MAIKKIDMNSEEFKAELVKTTEFTEKVLKQFGFVFNPDKEIVDGIQVGLTRNKFIYGKRYCPCFFVQQEDGVPTKDNRICPCPPALKEEIPNDGRCHCQIYCTPDYAKSIKATEELEVAAHEHSRDLNKDECEELLSKRDLDSDELESLLKAREKGVITFVLVDTREWMEHISVKIKGTDVLIPTTAFYDEMKKLDKSVPVILYCHSGSRSAFCQKILLDFKYNKVANLTFGIVSYRGEVEKG